LSSEGLTHFDAQGRAHMVDVGDKSKTEREAIAVARVRLLPATLEAIRDGSSRKGDVLGVARIAGIMGAKRTADLIPLCHPIPLSHVAVVFALDPAVEGDRASVWVRATARCADRTGVEMEALCAASVAALTLYDMCKAIDRGMELASTFLLHKSGGRSGDFDHPDHHSLGPPPELSWL